MNQNSIKLEFGDLGTPESNLKITRTSPNLSESEGTVVTIPGMKDKDEVGGFCGTSGPGPSGIESKTVNTGGAFHVSAYIAVEKFKTYLESIIQSKERDLTIPVYDSYSNIEGFDLKIDASALSEAMKRKSDFTLTVDTLLGRIKYPVSLLQKVVDAQGSSIDKQLQFIIDKLPWQDEFALTTKVIQQGGSMVGSPLSFELRLTDKNNQSTDLNSFPDYIGHTILLPKDFKLLEGKVLVGAVWDKETKTMTPIPLEYAPGVCDKPGSATLWNKGNSVYTVYTMTKSFPDLPATHFAKTAVDTLAAKNVLDGFEDGTFRADEQVTRAQFASMLVRALALPAAAQSRNKFSDISQSDWYYDAVQLAVNASLISGYEDGTFRPNQNITHQEAVTMLANAQKSINATLSITADEVQSTLSTVRNYIAVDDWARESAALAVKWNYLKTADVFQFNKSKNTNRGETALLLSRLLDNVQWPKP